MSMAPTRATLLKLQPQRGDGLSTNRRRRILTMTEDTSRGDHARRWPHATASATSCRA
ncbi:hypothetical protein [Siccirubricoccus soli]|uniref:hypothetical protein n=1 Tax=Siccirubricoccus soli TaxID=2899147 RepID=UPI0035117364